MVEKSNSKIQTANLRVDRISCQGCVNTIEKKLAELPGLSKVHAHLADSRVEVGFEPNKISLEEIRKRLDELNYTVETSRITLDVEGMHCASCVSRIEKDLDSFPGIMSARVNLAEETAQVEYLDSMTDISLILKKVEDSGYHARKVEDEKEVAQSQDTYLQKLKLRFKIALPLSALIFVLSHLQMLGISRIPENVLFPILLILAIPVQFYCGSGFYRGFFKSLKSFSSNMDTLVAVGTSAAFIYSLIATFYPGLISGGGQQVAVYYDTATMIITLILFGRIMENRAKRSATHEIEKLVELKEKTALVERDGSKQEIPVADVRLGDTVIVKPGRRLPVDGVVISGRSALDESALTGESLPREIEAGHEVMSGSINLTGVFKYEARTVGADTAVNRIIESVREIISSRAPIQRLADRVASIFVPVVIVLALIAFTLWMTLPQEPDFTFAMLIFIAVLIISCPCALGLATPTAIMVGSARGAREGILIKSAEILERTHGIDTVVFDKTGTLTVGQPRVEKIVSLGSYPREEILRLSASLENASDHPLAKAVIRSAHEHELELVEVENIEYISGKGLKGEVEQYELHLGNRAFLKDEGIAYKEQTEKINQLQNEGKTVLLVAIDFKLEALIVIADQVRSDASQVVERIISSGREVWMLSGDTKTAAESIAGQLGIENVMGEVLPEEKAAQIRSLADLGKRIAMVGDGINDAPALAEADVGIALAGGTEVALAFSDITILGDDLKNVPKALSLSERTLKTIKQNLVWAFGYNVIAIPLAAGALYPWLGILLSPVVASAAMAFSSVFVVTNSLRLRTISYE
ncbi:MAG: heavy metal translocating P-type ATPase [candidate division Zixibacteria bacterium]|nr:heavy metal translocating P-type ATPase [candidate division Zixibacteria bacterium]